MLGWWVVGIDRALLRFRGGFDFSRRLSCCRFSLVMNSAGRGSVFLGRLLLFFSPLVLGFDDELLPQKKVSHELRWICYVR